MVRSWMLWAAFAGETDCHKPTRRAVLAPILEVCSWMLLLTNEFDND